MVFLQPFTLHACCLLTITTTKITDSIHRSPNVTVKLYSLLIGIREVPGLNLQQMTNHERSTRDLSQPFQVTADTEPEISPHRRAPQFSTLFLLVGSVYSEVLTAPLN